MGWKITEIQKLRDGRLHIYKQSNCRFWLCRFYTEGRYKVTSTKELSFSSAKSFAGDWYDNLRFRKKNYGESPHERLFKDVAGEFIKFQENLVIRKERSSSQAKGYEIQIKGPLKYFNELGLNQITYKKIDEFKGYRLTTPVKGKSITLNTIKHDFVALRQVIKFAVLQGWLERVPEFPHNKIKPNPRTWFDRQEYRHLLKVSKNRIKSARGKRQRWEREQLHDYILFMVHSGCRVSECLSLQYGDITIIKEKQDRNQDRLRFSINGKTGHRPVVAMFGAVRAFERLQNRNPGKPEDKLFPQNHRDGFNELLKEAGLKYDKNGLVRNAKSLRSTYIMFRILLSGGKADIFKIARNCGTSPEVIDKYYAKYLTARMVEDDLIHIEKEV